MIEHVFLDLDDTILDFHKAEHLALAGALRSFGIEPTQEVLDLYSKINLSRWEMLERGELTRHEVLVSRFEILFERLGVSIDAEVAQVAYEDRLSVGHYFIPGAVELLQALSGKYHLYITSNGNKRVQDGRLASANISHYFEKIFISEVVGYDKPSKAFFDAVFSAIGDPPRERCIIVGDSLSSDIKGGCLNGIRTVWFNPKGKNNTGEIHPDYEVSDLSQIPELLKKIN